MTRRKLFSEGETLRTVICADCGYKMETAESPSAIYCPRCGGRRFNISLFPKKERKAFLSDYDTDYEKSLKECGGKRMKREDFERTFSGHTKDLLEKKFANVEGDSVIVSPEAYGIEKLFSKLTISVTKTLELDPECMRSGKEEVLQRLREDHGVPERGIVILRKAHGLPERHMFSEECEEDWVRDSNIIPDLENEYNNQQFGIEQFVRILRGRYPDAPERIIDILADRGTIILSGSTITVHKNN